jgi:putative mycofactocin binding protein MftB
VSTDVLDRAWRVPDQVAVRPERFGALLYHFGTRRLSFLKDPKLLVVVERLGDSTSARAACVEAGVTESELGAYEKALGRLVDTEMVVAR